MPVMLLLVFFWHTSIVNAALLSLIARKFLLAQSRNGDFPTSLRPFVILLFFSGWAAYVNCAHYVIACFFLAP